VLGSPQILRDLGELMTRQSTVDRRQSPNFRFVFSNVSNTNLLLSLLVKELKNCTSYWKESHLNIL